MELEEYIYNYLIGITDLTALVADTSIGWIDIKQDTDYPRVVFKNITRQVLYDASDEWHRWRFYIYHANKNRCRDIAKVLSDNLNRFSGDMEGKYISYVQILSDSDPVFQEPQNVYEIIQDYKIIFN